MGSGLPVAFEVRLEVGLRRGGKLLSLADYLLGTPVLDGQSKASLGASLGKKQQ